MPTADDRPRPLLTSEELEAAVNASLGHWLVDGNEHYYISKGPGGGLVAHDAAGKELSAAWVMLKGSKVSE